MESGCLAPPTAGSGRQRVLKDTTKSGETRTNFLQVAPILPARWVQQPVYGLIAVVNAVMFLGL